MSQDLAAILAAAKAAADQLGVLNDEDDESLTPDQRSRRADIELSLLGVVEDLRRLVGPDRPAVAKGQAPHLVKAQLLTRSEAEARIRSAVAAETSRLAAEIAALEAGVAAARSGIAQLNGTGPKPAPLLTKADLRSPTQPGTTEAEYLSKADAARNDPTERQGYRELAAEARRREQLAPPPPRPMAPWRPPAHLAGIPEALGLRPTNDRRS